MHREEPATLTGTAWWGLASAMTAPVLLGGGWTWAASVQPDGFDSVRDSISALAGSGATHRWIMTSALAAVGFCHVLTATALRAVPRAGRLVLALGGLATVGVAAAPLPAAGASAFHTSFAVVAFVALAVWPSTATSSDPSHRPAFPLRGPVRAAAVVVLTGLVCWFGAELVVDGGRLGLAERVAAGAQAVWPLVTALGSGHRDTART